MKLTLTDLEDTDLEDIANGACIYASGGGGSILMKRPLLDQIKLDDLEIVNLEDVNDEEMLAVSAGAGSPTSATADKVVGELANATIAAFKSLSDRVVGDANFFKYVAAIETGIGNTLLPLIVASRYQIPAIDAAGALRSVPKLSMCTFASNGIPIDPVILTSNKNNKVTYEVEPPGTDGGAAAAEVPLAGIISSQEFGNIGGIAFWSMNGQQAKQAATPGTIAAALNLGKTLREAKNEGKDPVEAVCQAMNGYILLKRGKLDSVQTNTSGSLDSVKVIFNNMDKNEEYFRIYALNESLIAWKDNVPFPVAMAPDLICYLTCDGEVFTNADLDTFKDQEIAVIGVPAQKTLRVPSVIEAFLSVLHGVGYGGPYVPIEKLQELEGVFEPGKIWGLPQKLFSQPLPKSRLGTWRGSTLPIRIKTKD
ncbi:DUF917 domain-containing protein [Okeania sp. SIO1I7]|uniref:DUF917 domain-containing protein n=1 Tax=Okeania sp. SIO1I7 TaxID=2607772 RepID=UPI0013FAE80F|nr:DUF917 domain-containing protein [Okeania sp. SIO1I7]NET28491.1 DUF917 domain-containing protein [Okeania sp. SIO1I7]